MYFKPIAYLGLRINISFKRENRMQIDVRVWDVATKQTCAIIENHERVWVYFGVQSIIFNKHFQKIINKEKKKGGKESHKFNKVGKFK